MQRIQCSGNEYIKSVSRMGRSGLVCVTVCAPEIIYMSECKGRIDRIEGLSRITIKVCGPDDKAFITSSGIRVHRMGLLDPIVLAKIKQDRVLDDEYKLLLRYTSSGMECSCRIQKKRMFQDMSFYGREAALDRKVTLLTHFHLEPELDRPCILWEFLSLLKNRDKNIIIRTCDSSIPTTLKQAGFTSFEEYGWNGMYLYFKDWNRIPADLEDGQEPVQRLDTRKTAARINEVMEYLDLNCEDLYPVLGLNSARAMYKWRSGETRISYDHLLTLSQISGVGVSDILVRKE